MKKLALGTVLACSLLLTAACESSEERAEKHFQDGMALLQSGDVDRALVEFRNVFRLDGTHKEARRAYAKAEIERGNFSSGYGQYLRLVEQYPDDVDAQRELIRLSLQNGDWSEVAKYAPMVLKANASDAIGRLADLGLRYRAALEAKDDAALAGLAEEALALRAELPDDPVIPQLLADYYVREGRREDALAEFERAIKVSPDPRRLYAMRLGLLNEMGDLDEVEAGLIEMVARYPDDPSVQASLVRWYLSQNQIDKAEDFLRRRGDERGSPEKVDLVKFLIEYRGRDSAIAELDALVTRDPENAFTYRALRAGLVFEGGQQEAAIAELQSIVDGATEDNDQVRNVKVGLAQMLAQTGNSVGARALVEDVLTADPSHVAALKMRAAWLIEADDTDGAILALRAALEQSPRDPMLMTAMAQAYERSGNRALMAEMLSLAVEVSNRAPAESARYARYLMADGKADVAERTLVDSLRLNPDNSELLQLLGSIYVQQQDWARAGQVADTLAGIGAPAATSASNALRAQVLAGQGRSDEVVGFLEQLVEQGEAGFGVHVVIVRTYLNNGDVDAAMQYLDEKLAADPKEPTLRFLRGAVLEVQGKPDEAEAIYAELTQETPNALLVWRALYALQQRAGRVTDASATLDKALAVNPESADLLWIKASELQLAGDLAGALAVYEKMYEQNSSAPIIANNYASLLSTLHTDQASIDRAYAVARRLQGVDVPAFRDTLGWIAYLRGEIDVAVENLSLAAAALTNEPTVQYHAALAFDAAGRKAEATDALKRAIALAEGGTHMPQLEEARQKLAEIEATGN